MEEPVMGNLSVQQARQVIRPQLEEFLAKVDPVRGRLVFGLDATASRQPTWDMAAKLQDEMFRSVAGVGGLDVQLVYFRGLGECVASKWISDPRSLTSMMQKISCQAGTTQIEKVLLHAREENAKQKIAGLIFVGDACEETAYSLYAQASELSVPTFMFLEGDDQRVEDIFREIARLTNGAFAKFDASAAARLADLLKAVAAFAIGGLKALSAQKTEAATLLLTQIRK
jgi:hypothetical protein